jgi:hypothetical protein
MSEITNEFFQIVCVWGFEGNKMSPNPLRCTTWDEKKNSFVYLKILILIHIDESSFIFWNMIA